MSTTTNTTQITLRHVDSELKTAIDEHARVAGKSINQFVLDLIGVCVGIKPTEKKPDWHKSIGVLPKDAFNDEALAELEAVDETMWQ
jgi:hypothetical protein